jgi:hypothetical protein
MICLDSAGITYIEMHRTNLDTFRNVHTKQHENLKDGLEEPQGKAVNLPKRSASHLLHHKKPTK